MAERLAAAMGEQLQIPAFAASSAGTRAVVGHAIHPSAMAVLDGLGGDGSAFAARQLTSQIASNADLVLTMTRDHRDAVLERAPQKLRSTFTVVEASRLATEFDAQTTADLALLRSRISATDSFDIPDPIGQTPEVFASIGQRIADLLPPILELCLRSASAVD